MEAVRDQQAVHVIARGRVQGVGFRDFIRIQAERNDICGWVRNLPDGSSIEIQAKGSSSSIETFIELARQGPPGSRIDQVDVEWISPRGLPETFEIRR